MHRDSKFGYLKANTILFAEKVCGALFDMGGAGYTIHQETLVEGPFQVPYPVVLFIEFSGEIHGTYILSLDVATAAALAGISLQDASDAAMRNAREEFSGYLKEVLNVAVGQAIEELGKSFQELTFFPSTVVYGEIEFPPFMGATIEIEGREGTIVCGFLLNLAHLRIGERLEETVAELVKKLHEAREERRTSEAILELLPVGLVAIDRNGSILPGYSRATLELTGDPPETGLAGRSLFAALSVPVRYSSEWKTWLRLVFEKFGEQPFEELEDLCILGEFTSSSNKRLKLTWLPVADKETGCLDKLLAVIEDLSKEHALRHRLKLFDDRHQETLDMVGSIVNLHPDDLSEFTSDAAMLAENALVLLEQKRIEEEQIDEIFRAFHTLKGTAGHYHFSDLKELAHKVEEHLDGARNNQFGMSDETIAAIRVVIEKARGYIDRIGVIQSKLGVREVVLKEPAGKGIETVPVALSSIDEILSMLKSTDLSIRDLERESLYRRIAAFRTVTLGSFVEKYQSLVKSTSIKTGKQVRLTLGNDSNIDITLIRKVQHILLHLFNNAVDHGIEAPSERIRSGKAQTGLVVLSGEITSGVLKITVSDDGRGIPTKLVQRTIQEKYGFSRETVEGMTDGELYQYLLKPGFTTRAVTTDVSGRGVGMDVVNTIVKELQGSLTMTSTSGVGTMVTITLPAII